MPALLLAVLGLLLLGCTGSPRPVPAPLLAELVDPAAINSGTFDGWSERDTVVLQLRDGQANGELIAAAGLVRAHGLRLGYWFEVARNEALADAHPDWVASLQGHDEWRLQHGAAPAPAAGEVAIAWPWVPVAYGEAFDAHRERIAARLAALPAAELVFLNDLQGPPSACGCGNALCRWAVDYTLHGAVPQRRATPLGPDAAARFVAAVQAMVPDSRVIPVWVTECEDDDTAADGACHGVGCYHGACWREFDRQWAPLIAQSQQVALLLPYRAFGRDLPRFGAKAGWVRFAIEHLRAHEREHHDRELAGEALIAVVQGWVDGDDVPAQVAQARAAGVRDVLIATAPIEQSFEPRLR